jgi:hypothetical protein
MTYLLDADVFIRAKTLHYGFDFCPAFWDWLDRAHLDGRVFSIEKVGSEIVAGGDELADWAAARTTLFLAPDPSVLPSLGAVSVWAAGAGYEPAAVNTFLDVADYYLVAQARAHGHVVVTHERASPSTEKIKIPTACIGLGVRSMTPFEMLRVERARFVLPA